MNRLSSLTASLLAATMLMPATTLAASDAEIDALKAQLKAVTDRLNQLEAEQKKAAAKPVAAAPAATATSAAAAPGKTAVAGEGQPVVGGSVPGSFKLPGTDTSIKFGGYAKLDAIEDSNGYGAQFANFAAIPLSGSASDKRDGAFNMHARQSRLNMETHTPTSMGDLKTFMEVDFFGSARGNANTTNGEGLQLRQAYGQVGGLLAGQTWSNFMDLDAYPESLDYIGPAGLTFVRQPQIRYGSSITPHTNYAVALEAANADFAPDVASDTDVNASDLPDLTGKLQWKDTFGELSLRGVARKLNAGTASGSEDSTFGWGLGASGKILAYQKDALFFQGVYGEGVGHYLFDVAITQNGSTYVGNNIDARPAWGGYAGYQHYWSDHWRSNLLFGYTGIDNGPASYYSTSPNKEVMSGHLNLIWEPAKQYRVGLEYMHGHREVESGTEGDLDRVQTSFMYLF